MSGRSRLAATLLSVVFALLAPAAAQAQTVTGLEVRQDDGFATLSWDPVEGAEEYEIQRTPVNEDDEPIGDGEITGVWRPNRTVSPDSPTFADAGFNPGERFQWRVRARIDGATFSEPVAGTTNPPFGNPESPGEGLRTQWEQTQAAQYTSDENEYAYTAALDAASERVRVEEIGRTVLGRPINMFIIGYPAPPRNARTISKEPAVMVNCNVHGNEPSSREACLILARELAFAVDFRTVDFLSRTTVLIVPTINGDGRAADTRGNSTGQDLNRDHSLLREPETFALAEALRDYTPESAFDGHEFGNRRAGDLPVLWSRHLNVARSIFDTARGLIEGWMYGNGSQDGWWYCPYGCDGGGNVGLSQETILRNTLGLKNVVGALLEARSSGGETRPNETSAPPNRRRKTYSALYTYQQFLDYYRANRTAVAGAVKASIKFQRRNDGRIVFRGSRDIAPYPEPHPGEDPPPPEPANGVIDPPPCGYMLSDPQYRGPQPDGRPVADRLKAHGIEVKRRGRVGWFVKMRQPLRGLIPLLLDGEAAEPMVAGERTYC